MPEYPITSDELAARYPGRHIVVDAPDLVIIDGWFQVHELQDIADAAAAILGIPRQQLRVKAPPKARTDEQAP